MANPSDNMTTAARAGLMAMLYAIKRAPKDSNMPPEQQRRYREWISAWIELGVSVRDGDPNLRLQGSYWLNPFTFRKGVKKDG